MKTMALLIAPFQACIEVCVDDVCNEHLICGNMSSSGNSAAVLKTNVTADIVSSMVAIVDVINTTMNDTMLPCTKRIQVRLDEVPFAVCVIIILILSLAIIVYAIGKKRLQLYRHGNVQTGTA